MTSWSSWVWLIPAVGILLFANGASNIPLAAWLAPFFLLRFVRTQRAAIGLPVAYLTLAAAFAFQFRGMVPIPGVGYYIFLTLFALPLVLPYVIDRLVSHHVRAPFLATLIFPTAFVSTEYLVSLGPYGSWGSIAYSQYGKLALLQLLSVTGLWGLTFLITWFASMGNFIWSEGLDSRPARRGALVFALVLVAILLCGEARLALSPSSGKTTRVASLSRGTVKPVVSNLAWDHLLQNRASELDIEEFRQWSTAVNDDLLARAEREAQAGARIVFWGEGNAPVFKDDEAALLRRGGELASKHQIYLGMAMATWHRDTVPSLENKLVLIGPGGLPAWEFLKARPIPGSEAEMSIKGDGRLPILDTPYGRLSSIICFDADFPQLLAQAGTQRADVVLDPSNDWRAIDPWHTQMASFRAVEQGFNLIRHTDNGLSAAFDFQGKRLAAMDHYQADDHVMITQVPNKGVRTIYSLLGDWFAWLCMATMLFLCIQTASLALYLRYRRWKTGAILITP